MTSPFGSRVPIYICLLKMKVNVLVAQSCLTFCDPTDCSLPGSSVHGISQARILEWVAISFSRGSSCPRDQIQVSCIAADSSTSEPPGKPHMYSTINIHTAVMTDERSIISNYFSFPPVFLLFSSLSIIKFNMLLNKFELIMCPILKTGL